MALFINNLDEFEKTVQKENSVLAIFYSKTCAQCKAMAPMLDQLIQQTPHITFIKVDVEEAVDICTKYNVKSVGTFIKFKNGELVKQLAGAGKDGLMQLIQE